VAKVTLTFTDTEEDGGVNFRVEFDPPLSSDESADVTHAQAEGMFIAEIMTRRAEGQTLAEMAEEIDDADYGEVIPETAQRENN
jgi:hypothetical protein